MTDRQTDRLTHDDGIYRASMASRGKNWTDQVMLDATALPGTSTHSTPAAGLNQPSENVNIPTYTSQ